MTVENLTALFDKLKVTESLELCEDFSAVRNFPFTVKSIRIFVFSWITSNHLNLMKDCVVIQLRGSTLTDQDVTSFLDKWKSGDYPNLQYLYIGSDNLSQDFKVFGLPTLHNFSGSPFEKQILGQTRVIRCAADVEQNGRVVAKIKFTTSSKVIELLVL
ncbi:hypothetical protein CRE_20629 [Caenorhabditis remanei]|uniref:Sdz-33 F-box domain-containing protein n=1 Tax=Caenorhabditis remanei TaxID=31234 RepID=E3NRT4_CAERE|nr:hypothetical protein CRE_20629 [Caenorhabditis remanei]